jgi:hypothetical protein
MGDRYHIDMVILDIGMGYGLMKWEMTTSIWSSPISMSDILSLCQRTMGTWLTSPSSHASARCCAIPTLRHLANGPQGKVRCTL